MGNNIGEKLRNLRKSKKLTTQEVENKVNVSQSYIRRFEDGHAIPDIDLLDKILLALDTNLATFFSEDFEEVSVDLIQLIDTVKTLSPEARIKLSEFIKLVQKDN